MAADRWIALAFLVFSLIYGWAAWSYPILPFEQNNPFKPNTLPLGLAAAGVLLSVLIIVGQRAPTDDAKDSEGLTLARIHHYAWPQALGLITAMVAYALLLRPLGFLAATMLFLGGSAVILGERRFAVLIPVVVIGAAGIWYLVDEVLGIFLRPWPIFLVG